MINVERIDWNMAWKERRARRTSSPHDSQFWDKRAPSFARNVAETGYAESFMKIMDPKPTWSVFDMACGPGTLAIPLANRVRTITAADFSGTMLAILEGQMKEKEIGNIRTVKASWEDNWEEKDIGVHDAVISSRSLVVHDLREGIMKLEKYARERVYISTIVGDGPFDRRIFEAIGRKLDMHPDYIYNYNLLYQMGIHANVAFIENQDNKTYASRAQALESLRWMFGDMTANEEDLLSTYLDRHLAGETGRWMMDNPRTIKWAVLWWDKEKGQDQHAGEGQA